MRFEIERYGKNILGLLGAALLFAVTAFAQRGATPACSLRSFSRMAQSSAASTAGAAATQTRSKSAATARFSAA